LGRAVGGAGSLCQDQLSGFGDAQGVDVIVQNDLRQHLACGQNACVMGWHSKGERVDCHHWNFKSSKWVRKRVDFGVILSSANGADANQDRASREVGG
jgi:hypothetical protein